MRGLCMTITVCNSALQTKLAGSRNSCRTTGKGGKVSVDGTRRADVRPGMRVSIVLKKDQRTGALTEGIVKDILTGSPVHIRGIKVRLESGEVGRVRKIGA
jgi:uncharacterized repeat protein (TIGR03833 family)